MKLHTFEQVKRDIESFENIGIQLDTPDNIRFVKLYSECFLDRVSGNSAVVDLRNRILKYLSETCLSQCDIWPDDDHAFYVYDSSTPSKTLTLLGTADEKETALALMCSEDVGNKTTKVCVVSTKTREVMYFSRSLH